VRSAAAEELGATGLPEAEGPLVRALGSPAPEVRVAAARALGRAGTAASVSALREAAEANPDGGLRRAVRQAVAEIQSRIGGAEPGQLSLATGEAESGRLSIAEERSSGRLSLSGEEGPAGAPAVPPKRTGAMEGG
jgi:hypothetical protein